MKKKLIVDFAACEGGALSVLLDYYNEVKNDSKNVYYFLLSDNYFEETKNIKIIIMKKYKNRFRRLIFDYLAGREIVKNINPDEVISLQNTIIRGIKVKQSVFVHQSIPFQKIKNFSFFKKKEKKYAIIQHLIGRTIISSIKKADKVVVQTQWMKKSIVEKCGILPGKVEVKYPKVTISNDFVELDKKDNIVHFFYPTSDYIYKNNDIIYTCVSQMIDDGITNFEVEITLDGESSNNIKKIGRIKREEVFSKYRNSVLIFPSYIETFGLPLAEARMCNSIILASDTDFSHEVLEGYDKANFFNPFSADELKKLMIEQINKKGENKR